MDTRLAGRIALVTGGSRGLGQAIAVALAESGADVAVCFSKDADGAQETVSRVERIGSRAMAAQVDIRDCGAVSDLVSTVSDTLGPIDICVSNAGVPSPGLKVADTEAAEFRRVLDVHLMGAFHCARAVIPGMRERSRGDLIFISSEVTAKTPAGRGPYTAGKAGIEALARTIALEEREHGIRANCIAPGVVNTGYVATAARRRGFQTVEEMAATMPFRRLVEPAELGALCVFLASDGGYISGEVIYVNGGG